jgi:hypothetical protein
MTDKKQDTPAEAAGVVLAALVRRLKINGALLDGQLESDLRNIIEHDEKDSVNLRGWLAMLEGR